MLKHLCCEPITIKSNFVRFRFGFKPVFGFWFWCGFGWMPWLRRQRRRCPHSPSEMHALPCWLVWPKSTCDVTAVVPFGVITLLVVATALGTSQKACLTRGVCYNARYWSGHFHFCNTPCGHEYTSWEWHVVTDVSEAKVDIQVQGTANAICTHLWVLHGMFTSITDALSAIL